MKDARYGYLENITDTERELLLAMDEAFNEYGPGYCIERDGIGLEYVLKGQPVTSEEFWAVMNSPARQRYLALEAQLQTIRCNNR